MFSKTVIKQIELMAAELRVEPAALLAVAEVESAGVSEWNVHGQMKPAIRFEGHYFHRILKAKNKAKLRQAVAAGLANPRAGAVKNPNSFSARYDLLERAAKIDRDAAYESTSWGLGQVMGAHWAKLGYASVEALVKDAMRGVDGQVRIMQKYIRAFGLVDELQSKGWLSFALQYNGPAARKNRYDAKIAAAYKRWSKAATGTLAKDDSAYAEYQGELKRLGYYKGNIDGVNGEGTKAAVRRFQKDNGLVPDGKVGPNTRDALDEALRAKSDNHGDNALKTSAAATATAAAGETAQKAVDAVNESVYSIQPAADALNSNYLQYFLTGLIVLAAVLTIYGLYVKFVAKKRD